MKGTRIWVTSAIVFMVLLNLILVGTTGDLSETAIESITAEELKPLLEFLASDELAGRAVNTSGTRTAARFIAYQFQQIGMSPAGDEGSYFQNVPLLQAELGEKNSLEIRKSDASHSGIAVLKKDFLPSHLSANGKTNGKLIFVSYGISAPELNYDDYSGISVQG